MRAPMAHTGCASTSSRRRAPPVGMTAQRPARGGERQPRAPRPRAVPAGTAAPRCARCPPAAARRRPRASAARTSGPPTTSVSLFASASRAPALERRQRRREPAGADDAVDHESGAARAPRAVRPRPSPSSIVAPGAAAASRRARRVFVCRMLQRHERRAATCDACSHSRSRLRPAASAVTRRRSDSRAATSSACSPIEPVLPRIANVAPRRHRARAARLAHGNDGAHGTWKTTTLR